MKYLIVPFLLCCLMLAFSNAFAQLGVGPLMLDPSFANNGKSEIDFEGFNNDATCFVANLSNRTLPGPLDRILAAGKIYTSIPGEIHFGIVEYDANGIPASNFGTNGKADLNWDSVDYPNAIDLMSDGSILAVGASATDLGHIIPTIFRLNSNGTPDSSFGTNGRSQFSPSFVPPLGEFENLDTLRLPNEAFRALAMGIQFSPVPEDQNAFYAVRFDSTGTLDSSFGAHNGQIEIKASIRLAQGHWVDGNRVMFVGISDTGVSPEIILCKLQSNGTPDSSFGTNGVLNTGITLHGGNQIQSVYDPSAIPPDSSAGLLVVAPIADSSAMIPFTIVKFKLDGTLDSNYGHNGLAAAPIIANMKVSGITVHVNNGNVHIAGSIGNVSATTQFLSNGLIDSTFGTNGVAIVDADSGLRKNFLIGLEPNSRRFIGIGTSVNANGNDDFLVARYIPGVADISPAKSDNSQAMQLFPNPAHDFVQVGVPDNPIEQISIVDALGRIVLSFERPSYASNSNSYFLDVSNIPNGAYHCTVRTAAGISSQRLTVIH
jgi:uncharacterized delta-60 repeat protein